MAKLAQLPANDGAPPAAAAEVHHIARPQVRYYAFLSYSHKDCELPTGCTANSRSSGFRTRLRASLPPTGWCRGD